MSDNSKIVVALLAGVAVGAALGILFAPERGSETRDRLGKALKDLGDTIKDLSNEGLDELSEVVDKVSDTVKAKARKVEDTLNETGKRAGL
jgi:gas vesicle protein